MIRVLKLCVCASFLSAILAVTTVHAPGGQHPDAHIDGFVLKSVFLHSNEANPAELHRRVLRFDDNPHLENLEAHNQRRSRLALPQFSGLLNSKQRVIAMAKLNLLAYDIDLDVENFYSDDVMAEVYKEKDSIFGDAVTDRSTEQEQIRMIYEAILDEVESPAPSLENVYRPENTQLTDGVVVSTGIGVAGLEFARGNVTVMVFRGTVTDGDNANIYNWEHDWVVDKMSDRMKTIWTDEAKLSWDDEMEGRSKKSTTLSVGFICTYNAFNAGLGEDLATASPETSLEQAKATGYWEITKAIADELHVQLAGSGDSLLFTGHSQGGTRAALASMYMDKKGNSYDAITFAATGPQCMARLMHSDADLVQDVDPFKQHPQITEYVHVLDPWGQALGLEVGNECRYGVGNIEASRAYKYCRKTWGYPGPYLWFNEGADALAAGDLTLQDKDVANAFTQCRYFTHYMQTMLQDLEAAGTLKDDGTTADGCNLASVADLADVDGLCPDPEHTRCKDALAVWIIIAAAVGGFVLLLCCCCCCYCLRRRRKKKVVEGTQIQSLREVREG
mmetsp:Transcript_59910/g.122971  ORF Transcript_59910/g.122971 Transcript_59910/m.122971 type:complete len:561 (-) Transcript_59910:112-1794(-)|eukprot:CAMPEP_0181322156 /NCGR_PEP_ID=MMETSP1101-20121128/19077_1 /TAXON_ID=46948 /ORGANISM="Rhodomonas abbreviata, Strain Caron Lab Isolate" /LENGTH=560 /DNA_ID=CAMNT_0023430049 /DNA_START=77 /DNA_END=1759 /DNA_ORIENTATION=-